MSSTDTDPALSTVEARTTTASLTWVSFLLSVVVLAGSLWLSLGMGLKACPLCYYQRTFVMGVVGVLGIGLLTGTHRSLNLSLLALPAAAGGFCVAGYHVYLELAGKLECPAGILGVGTGPQQSLAGFTLLMLVLGMATLRSPTNGRPVWAGAVGGLVLGGLFAWGAVVSVAPMPQPKDEDYKHAPDVCRKPKP